jgi:anti-anti-sigma regulatory factor
MLKLYENSRKDISSNSIFSQIEQFESDESFSIFHAQMDDQINAMIIKVNLSRAVFEHASFFKQFLNILLAHNINHYILDFSNTEFLDSTFLGSLIYFFKKVKNKSSKLSLVIDLSKITILSEVIDLVGIDIFTSLNEAKYGS